MQDNGDGMTGKKTEADVAFIEALIALMCENGLTGIRLEREYGLNDRLNVRLDRIATVPANPAPAVAPPVSDAPAPTVDPSPGVDEDGDPAQHPGAVTSPMVGTAYLSPEPGAEAFVSIGSRVGEGDTLMIVEAMKTMNHIPAPRAGAVTRILVADGDPVEFGAPLMIVE